MTCKTRFERRTKRMESLPSTDMPLQWICQELEQSAKQADILDLVHVWDRYSTLAIEAQLDIPSRFLSRRNSFKEQIADRLEGLYDFVVLHDQPQNEPLTVLVPSKYRHIPVSTMLKDDTSNIHRVIPTFKHKDQDMFLNMVHVALQIRRDMISHPKQEGIDISENRAIHSIPNSLYMFLNLLLGGQRLLEDDVEDYDKNTAKRQLRVLSIAQATRSKELVNMFHQAGHVMSYREVIKLDTELAKTTLVVGMVPLFHKIW